MTEEQKNNILCTASQFGSMEIITYLIEKYPEISTDYTKALCCACFGGQLETTVFFVEMGADIHVNYVDVLGCSCRSGHENIVRYLLETVPNIDINTNRYFNNGSLQDSLLLEAAQIRNINICKLLISSGAIIDDSFQHHRSKRWKNELAMIPCSDLLIQSRGKNINEIALELSDKLIYSSSKKERDKVIKELNQLASEYPIVGNIIENKIHQSKNND